MTIRKSAAAISSFASTARASIVLGSCQSRSVKMVQIERSLSSLGRPTLSTEVFPTPLGPTKFHAVLIVRGTVSYTDLSEMRTTEHVTRQRIEATRIGECPASEPGRQFHPNPQAIEHF